MKLVYDELFRSEFLCPDVNLNDLTTKIDMNLNPLEELMDANILEEEDVRDFVTHIFGTYTDKIEMLGFNCSSGKMYLTGQPNGKPFLISKYKHKFHYFNVGLNNSGMTFIKPFFKESHVYNSIMDYDWETFSKDDLEEEVFEDEIPLKKINNKKLLTMSILTPTVKDDAFYESDKDDISGDDLEDLISQSDNLSLYRDLEEELENEFGLEEGEGEENEAGEELENELGEGLEDELEEGEQGEEPEPEPEEEEIDENDEDEPRKNQYEYEYIYPNADVVLENIDNLKNVNSVLYKFEANNLKRVLRDRQKTLDKWDKISPLSLNLSTLLDHNYNYPAFVQRYLDDIKNEMTYRKSVEEKKNQIEENFYFRYFNRKPEKISTISEEQLLQEKKFNKISERTKAALNGFIYQSEEKPKKSNKIAGKNFTPQEKWKKLAESMNRRILYFGMKGVSGVIKALKILTIIEENFVDDETSFNDKVTVLNILTKLLEQRHLIKQFVGSEKAFDNLRMAIIKKVTKKKLDVKRINSTPAATTDKKVPSKKNTDTNKNNRDSVGPKKRDSTRPRSSTAYIDSLKNSINDTYNKIQAISNTGKAQDKVALKELETKMEELKREKSKVLQDQEQEIKKDLLNQHGVDPEKIQDHMLEERKKQAESKKEEAILRRIETENELKKKMTKPISFSEIEIPKDVPIFANQKLPQVKEFTDELFPACKNSLCPYNEKKKSWILPEGLDSTDVEDWHNFEWERVNKIFRSEDYQVFVEGTDADDINQGSLGDCYFLSSLAALCKYPSEVQELFHFKEKALDHCYGVYLRIRGIWTLVLLDDYVPCYGSFAKKFAFSNARGKELWVVLLEKAWAKVSGSYAKAIAGEPSEVFDAISNAYTETIPVTIKSNKDLLWTKINEGDDNGFLMTAGTSAEESIDYDSVSLTSGHAYTILSTEEVDLKGKKIRLIKLRNPWGSCEWSGDWSDSSPLWPKEIKEKLLGQEAEDNGVFFMSLDDFVKYFSVATITKVQADFKYSYVMFPKQETSGPCLSKVTIPSETQVYFQLHQQNARFLKENERNGHMFMMLLDSNFKLVEACQGSRSNITIEKNLKPGVYFIYSDINFRYTKSEAQEYNLTSYSKTALELEREKTLDPYDVCIKTLNNYSLTQCKPSKESDLTAFHYRASDVHLPFQFVTLQNDLKCDYEVEFANVLKTGNKSVLYPDTVFKNQDKITKKISPKQNETFIVYQTSPEGVVETTIKAKPLISDEELENLTKNEGKSEELDDDKLIIQKCYSLRGYYGLILENKTDHTLKMILSLENLSYQGKEQKEVKFQILKNSSKFFSLRVIPNRKQISFSFDFE
jgi:hypothetical protein